MTSSDSASDLVQQQAMARQRLQRDWLITAALAIFLLLGLAQLLRGYWVTETVGRWAILAGLAIFYVLRIFKQALPLMHRPSETKLMPGTGLAVKLTLLSGLGYALLTGFLLVTRPEAGLPAWLPAILAALAIIADILDGLVARKRQTETVGGKQLAQEFRALGSLVLTALSIHYGQLDPWFLAIGVMPYLRLFTISWLIRKQKALHPAPAQNRHRFNVLLMAALSISLWPVTPRSVALLLSLLTGLPYFVLALRDWLLLTGLLDPQQSHYQQLRAALNRALQSWIALSIRLLAAMAALTVAADMVFHFDSYAMVFSGDLIAGALLLILLVAVPLLLLGVRVRLASLVALAVLAALFMVRGPNTVVITGVILLGLTLLLGQGNLALEKETPPPNPDKPEPKS